MSWWNPFAILTRHEKRLDDLHQAMTAHVSASISRMDLVEKQQRDLSATICTHKDENAKSLKRIEDGMGELTKRTRLGRIAAVGMILYRLVTASFLLVGAIVCYKHPELVPYLAQIASSILTKH